jgi:hypothetical protein
MRAISSSGPVAGLCVLMAAAPVAGAPAEPLLGDEPRAGSLLRVFTDSDRVTVKSFNAGYAFTMPRQSLLNLHWNHERVTIPAIDAPVGSSEAVDAITTASRPISGNAYTDFVKVRNEITGAWDRGAIGVDYYLSTESDYLAQQLGARWQKDYNDQRLNFSFGTSVGWDAIEPLADDDTNLGGGSRTTLHWNAVATQVVSPTTMVRLGAEYNVVDGLQHNPYRNVYAGGTNVPERHPDARQRRDVFVKLNQYLPNRSSGKLSYRLYNDDWGINSHEVGTRLSQYITGGMFARYEYRWYSQTAAEFWSDDYTSVNGIDGYLTGDYRMGRLSSHLFGAALDFDFTTLRPETPVLGRLDLWFSVQRYFNSNNYSANIFETGLDVRF